MASAACFSLRTIFLLLCALSAVNESSVFERKLHDNFDCHSMSDFYHRMSNVSQGLHAMESVFQSPLGTFQWSHVALLVKVAIAVYFLIHQLHGIMSNERELDYINEHSGSVALKVQGVSQFFKDTGHQFRNLNSKSGSIMEQFRTIGSDNITMSQGLFNEIKLLKKSFHKQQSIFTNYGIDLDDSQITGVDIKAQLTMAKGYIGREISRIEADVAEDRLSIAGVKKDIQSLKAYFGQRSK